MINLKTKPFFILSFGFAILGYIISSTGAASQVSEFLPSIFVLLTASTLFFISNISSQPSANNSSTHKASTNTDVTSQDISTLYIGNLAYKANEEDVQTFFEEVGNVNSVRLVKDKRSGRRKGFGFVEIASGEEDKFISKLNKAEFMERSIIVRYANEKQH